MKEEVIETSITIDAESMVDVVAECVELGCSAVAHEQPKPDGRLLVKIITAFGRYHRFRLKEVNGSDLVDTFVLNEVESVKFLELMRDKNEEQGDAS